MCVTREAPYRSFSRFSGQSCSSLCRFRTCQVSVLLMLLLVMPLNGQLPRLTLQTGHSDKIVALAFSSDGKYLASAGRDNVIIIWDFRLGKQIKRLEGHTGTINCVRFFPSGYRLASGGDDGHLIIWDMITEKAIHQLDLSRKMKIASFDITPDGETVLIGGNIPTMIQWNLKDSSSVRFLPANRSASAGSSFIMDQSVFFSVRYFPEVNQFIVGRQNGIYCFSAATGNVIRVIKPDKKRIFTEMTADGSGNIVTTDIKCRKRFGKKISYLYPRIIKWAPGKSEPEYIRSGDYIKYAFLGASVNAGMNLLSAWNEDYQIYVWDYKTGRRYPAISKQGKPISTMLFYPKEEHTLVCCYDDRAIYVWDLSSGKVVRQIGSATQPVTAIAVNDQDNVVSFACADNSLRLLELGDVVNVETLPDHSANICGLGFTHNDLVSVELDNRISFMPLSGNGHEVSIKGNKNPALLNSVGHLPVLSLFANPLTSYWFTKKLLLNDFETLTAMDMSSDGTYTAAGGKGFRSGIFYKILVPRIFPVVVVNNKTHRVEKRLKAHYGSVDALSFAKNGTLLASSGTDYSMESGSYMESFQKKQNYPDEPFGYRQIDALKIWDIHKKKPIAAFENQSPIVSLAFHGSDDTLFFADKDNNILLYNFRENKARRLGSGMGPIVSMDGMAGLLYQDSHYAMNLYRLSENKVIRTFEGHNDKITSAVLLYSGNRLITGGWDGTIRLWDVGTGKEIVTIYALQKNDFLIKTPENYYYATKNAMNEIGFTYGMKFYPFEQFDLKFNRPDIVLGRLGNTRPELLAAYHRAYQKRLEKMGFTEEMLSDDFHVPEVTIENADSLQKEALSGKIILHIKAADTKYSLDRINVWINDVAVFGKQGINERTAVTQTDEKEIPLDLASGVNKIQVSALNQKGAESLRETFDVACPKASRKPDLYLVSVGVSKYMDSRFNLEYAGKDAADIASLFSTDTSLYGHVYVKVLTDNQVVSGNLSGIRQFFEKAGRNDVVMLFIAGHGLLDERLDYYFGTYNMDFNNPSGRGILYDDIEALLDGLKSLKKILLMDTCYSGEVDKDEVELAQTSKTEYGDVSFRSAGAGVRIKKAFGMANTSDLMKDLFSDLRKGTGSTVISSAGGAEFAMESSQWKNGLFTFCVLNGIEKKAADLNKDGKIMLSELQEYIRNDVTRLSGGRQSPTYRIQNLSMDFQVW